MLDYTHIKQFEKFITRGPDACWHWTGGSKLFKCRNTKGRANRLAFSYYWRLLTDGEKLQRLCESGDCINPLHQQTVYGDALDEIVEFADPDWGRWLWNDTHCRAGHVFSYANTEWADDHRLCRTCGKRGRG